jgi:hypothetical protein
MKRSLPGAGRGRTLLVVLLVAAVVPQVACQRKRKVPCDLAEVDRWLVRYHQAVRLNAYSDKLPSLDLATVPLAPGHEGQYRRPLLLLGSGGLRSAGFWPSQDQASPRRGEALDLSRVLALPAPGDPALMELLQSLRRQITARTREEPAGSPEVNLGIAPEVGAVEVASLLAALHQAGITRVGLVLRPAASGLPPETPDPELTARRLKEHPDAAPEERGVLLRHALFERLARPCPALYGGVQALSGSKPDEGGKALRKAIIEGLRRCGCAHLTDLKASLRASLGDRFLYVGTWNVTLAPGAPGLGSDGPWRDVAARLVAVKQRAIGVASR